MGTEIWDNANSDIIIEEFLEKLALDLKGISKYEREDFVYKNLKAILQEKKVLES